MESLGTDARTADRLRSAYLGSPDRQLAVHRLWRCLQRHRLAADMAAG